MKTILEVLGLGTLIGVGGPLIIAGALIIGIVILAFSSLIMAIPAYFVWNWLMPQIFHLPTLAYWQVWGLVFLLSLLFGGKSSLKS